tara:strand:+ start:1092 stop:1412 length:321 start_codon:yes stop_codon:yes gene_type:complete
LAYDQRRGLARRLFGNNHPCIEALLNLPEGDRNNRDVVLACFTNNFPQAGHASYLVWQVVQRHFQQQRLQQNIEPLLLNEDYNIHFVNIRDLDANEGNAPCKYPTK